MQDIAGCSPSVLERLRRDHRRLEHPDITGREFVRLQCRAFANQPAELRKKRAWSLNRSVASALRGQHSEAEDVGRHQLQSIFWPTLRTIAGRKRCALVHKWACSRCKRVRSQKGCFISRGSWDWTSRAWLQLPCSEVPLSQKKQMGCRQSLRVLERIDLAQLIADGLELQEAQGLLNTARELLEAPIGGAVAP